jgi:hypothetical protein
MKAACFLSLLIVLLICCDSPNRSRALANSTKALRLNGYFNWEILTADIDSAVQVENMSIEEVKGLLRKMYRADQFYRDSLHNNNHASENKRRFYLEKMKRNDEANLVILNHLTQKYGWPKTAVFGKEASETAWLVVWHHRNDEEVLSRFVPMITEAYTNGEVSQAMYNSLAKQLALLQSIR